MGPTTEDKQLRGQRAAEELQGTCRGLHEVLSDEEQEQEDEDVLAELDQHVFLCEECGWWCELSEQTEDGRCDGCNQEDD